MKPTIAAFLMTVTALAFTAPSAAEPISFAPHTARYTLRLLETRVGDIGDVNGEMTLSFVRGCEAWISQSQLDMTGGSHENPAIHVEAESAQREDIASRWLEFESTVKIGGELQEAIRGRAEVDENGRGEAVFSVPRQARFPLPKGTTFPVATARDAIRSIWVDNKKLVNFLIFDGDSPGPMRGTDIQAGTPDPVDPSVADPDGLTEGDPKRIVTTLFELAETDSEPMATYIGDTLPNGVLTRLTIDMGFMVVEARLADISAIPKPQC